MTSLVKIAKLLTVLASVANVFGLGAPDGRDIVFEKFGEFEGKIYMIPRNIKAHWQECRRLCEEYGMEFSRFVTLAEAQYIFSVMESYGSSNFLMYVDGATASPAKGKKTDWFWVQTNQEIDFLPTMKWARDTNQQPNFFQGDQWCLGLHKINGVVGWNDLPCYANANAVFHGPRTFLCQYRPETGPVEGNNE